MQSTEIEIKLLKAKLESVEGRLRFLESNWVKWTKETTAIGQQVVAGLLDASRKPLEGRTEV